MYNIEQQRVEKYCHEQNNDTQLMGIVADVKKEINSKVTETVVTKDDATEKVDSVIDFFYSPDDPIR